MVTILDHFDRKIISLKSSTLAPYGKRKIVILHSFLNKFSRLFDDHNNQHSPQEGVGKFLNLNSLLVKRQIDNPSPGAVTVGN